MDYSMTPEIKICADGMVRINGAPVFKRVELDGVIYLEFVDRDRMRSSCRGSKFVKVSLTEIIEKLNEKTDGK